jgi:hypothetical protein
MKKIVTLFLIFSIFVSCQSTIEKPDKLIEEEVMVDIIYDLAILEAIKSQKPASLEANNIIPKEYIYKKYKIDSLQFAKNNQYYASDIENYKKMYDRVGSKLEKKKTEVNSIKKPKSVLGKPTVQ